jgi:site-specific recombinase XerD
MIRGARVCRRWQDIEMADLELRKLVEHFSQSNRAEGKSPKTVEWYEETLIPFVAYLELVGGEGRLSEFSVESVREFIIREQVRALSPHTIQGKVRTLKVFSSWLHAEGYTEWNVLANVGLPKVPKKVIDPLRDDEIEKLVACQNPLTAVGCRNTAILTTLLGTGLRERGSCASSGVTMHTSRKGG